MKGKSTRGSLPVTRLLLLALTLSLVLTTGLAHADECEVHIVAPEGTCVHIRNVGYFRDGDWVEVEPGRTYDYRNCIANGAVCSGWKQKVFTGNDCGMGSDLTGEFCHTHIDLGGVEGLVIIQNVGTVRHCNNILLPRCATITYIARHAREPIYTGWWDKHVDCTPLVAGQEVEIDIKPRSFPNSINLKSRGKVPVAVLTTRQFDASTVNPNPGKVLFAGARPLRSSMEDVNKDGDPDMVFHFKTQDLQLTADSTQATFLGIANGKLIAGTDLVRIVHE